MGRMPRISIALAPLMALALAMPAPAAAQSAYDPGAPAQAVRPPGPPSGGATVPDGDAGTLAPAGTPRRAVLTETGDDGRHLLDGQWLFRADPLDAGLAANWERSASASGFTAIEVPHVFNAGDFSEASMLGGVGWYRKDFRVPAAEAATGWALRFEGAGHRVQAWLNGRAIGTHEGAYLPFELPAAGLRARGVNRLVVRVDSRTNQLDLPAGGRDDAGRLDGGWWNYGGIAREVYLRRVATLDVEDLWVRSEIDCATCAATLLIDARVRNTSGVLRAVSGVVRVTAPGAGAGATGARAARRRVRARRAQRTALSLDGPSRLRPGVAATYRARLQLGSPVLWKLGSGALYRVRLAVDGGGAYVRRHGIRSISIAPGGRLLLNGEPVSLRGASLHEDDPRSGSALSPERRRADVAALAKLGATVTRAHYPLHPHTLELLDRAGILLWAQAPVYQLREPQLADPGLRFRAVGLIRDQIRRDRSHPSVLTWSLGNELPSRAGPGMTATLEAMAAAARALDPDRPLALDILGHPGVETQMAYRVIDALGINDYFGWYPGPGGATTDRDDLGAHLDAMRASYPGHALVVTEFGAEANREGPAAEKGTYAFQSRFLRDHLATIAARPQIAGAITWVLRDFRVKPGWTGGNPQPSAPVNAKGLIDDAGREKPAFAELARLFRTP